MSPGKVSKAKKAVAKKTAVKKSAVKRTKRSATQKSSKSRRPRTGISFTRRKGKIEATYNISREQLPAGSNRKRITAWGDNEQEARDALLLKLTTLHLVAVTPRHLSSAYLREAQIALGVDGRPVKGTREAVYAGDRGPKLKDWVQEWQTDWIRDVQPSTKKIYDGHLRTYILPYLGEYHLNDLSAKVLKREWWEKIKQIKKVKDGEVTDEPALGKSALRNVYKTLRLILTTAFHKLGTRIALTEKLLPMPEQTRPESDREIRAAAARLRKLFIDEPDMDDPRWSLFALSLLGLRQGERLGISVSDLERDEGGLVINNHRQLDFDKDRGGWYLKDITKNGEPRVVPLWGIFEQAVKRQLEWRKMWKRQPDWNQDPEFADLLFLQPGGKIWTRRQDAPAWHEYVGPGIRGHLARHVTGYLLASEGISLEVAKNLLGHKSEVWVTYYRVVSTQQVRRELRHFAQGQDTNVVPLTAGQRKRAKA